MLMSSLNIIFARRSCHTPVRGQGGSRQCEDDDSVTARVRIICEPAIKWICPNIIYLYSSGRGGGINVKGFFCVVMSKNGAMRCIINTRYFPECLFWIIFLRGGSKGEGLLEH